MDSDHESISDKEEIRTKHATNVSKPKRNSKVGKSNYTREELLSLFTIMERILPIGTEEWEQVQLEHAELYAGRDIDSIRRKYNSLHRKQVPTGSPNITPEILAAKRIKYKIGVKADIGGGDDKNFDLEIGFKGSGVPGAAQPQDTSIEVSLGTPTKVHAAVARTPSPVTSALSVASSRVSRKTKDSNQDFLEMMKMQMMMDQEERREQRREDRKRRDEWTGLVTALVGGLTTVFGVQPPAKKSKQPRSSKNKDDSSDESIE